jgi:hypothetical protein
LAGALYAWLCCWIAWGFARDLWGRREGFWCAGLLGFFLIFDFPSSAIPLAADQLMLAPHLAAVWMAYRRRPLWAGALAGVAFTISPKGVLVLAVCAWWAPSWALLAGFVGIAGAASAWMWSAGALGGYWDEVWRWGRVYAGTTFVDAPLKNGLLRTLNWAGFHAAIVIAAVGQASWPVGMGLRPTKLHEKTGTIARPAGLVGRTPWSAADAPVGQLTPCKMLMSLFRQRDEGVPRGPGGPPHQATEWFFDPAFAERRRWLVWLAISLAGVAAGLRFFPRYYFQLLPVVVLLAARGFAEMRGRRRLVALLLLLIPLARFAPTYFMAARDAGWRDTAMDRDSRAAAAMVSALAKPGDTLFVWGFRPEIYLYSRLPAATRFLDSQPLTGVPADRHLTQSTPVETRESLARRAELAASRPTFVVDGLGEYNRRLAVTEFGDLRAWMAAYREVGRSAGSVIYRRE